MPTVRRDNGSRQHCAIFGEGLFILKQTPIRYRIARNHYVTDERSFAESACVEALKCVGVDVENGKDIDALSSPDALSTWALLSYICTLNFMGFIYESWTDHEKALKRLTDAEKVYAYVKMKVRSI